jgi:hypothetical protein
MTTRERAGFVLSLVSLTVLLSGASAIHAACPVCADPGPDFPGKGRLFASTMTVGVRLVQGLGDIAYAVLLAGSTPQSCCGAVRSQTPAPLGRLGPRPLGAGECAGRPAEP